MYLTEDYKDMISFFNKHDVEYLISGAYAMSKLGYSRATYDIDLWINKTPENALKVFNALIDFGVPFEINPDDFSKPNNILQIGIKPNRIDILTDIDGVDFNEAWKSKEEFDFNGLKAPGLSLEFLIKNKSATTRPKDKLDVVQLQDLLKQKEFNINNIVSQIKEINPDYKILTIDEFNSRLSQKIEGKEQLENKYIEFLNLELNTVKNHSKSQDNYDSLDYDNSQLLGS